MIKTLKVFAPSVGFEPTTFRLKDGSSKDFSRPD